MTAAELLVRGLQKRGIDWMATLCGHGLDPLFDAARNGGMRVVDALGPLKRLLAQPALR